MPHRVVDREEKGTTKIRAVFESSCSSNGPTLNGYLYSAPNLLSKTLDISLRFRLNKIGILADKKKAFLEVVICKEHIDYLHFLWFKDTSPLTDENIIVLQFLRVFFGIASSLFLLQSTCYIQRFF